MMGVYDTFHSGLIQVQCKAFTYNCQMQDFYEGDELSASYPEYMIIHDHGINIETGKNVPVSIMIQSHRFVALEMGHLPSSGNVVDGNGKLK